MARLPRLALVGVVVLVVVAGVLGSGVVSLDGDSRPALVELTGPGNPLVTDPGAGNASTPSNSLPSGGGSAASEDPRGATATTATPGAGGGGDRTDTDGDGLPDTREAELGTDPTDPDTDSDGLPDAREAAGVTDPTDPDTDGDGLGDGQELAADTSPVNADTDSDGLPDGRERELGTDPTLADTDGDDVGDERELEVGTDPTDPDTDGDQLLDGWEIDGRIPDRGTALPNASATRMDMYVQVLYGQFSTPFTERDKDTVEEEFEEMPVPNPDGSRGITVHFADEHPRGGLLDDPVRVTGPNGSFDDLAATYETAAYMDDRQGVYHLVLIGQVDADNRTGFGQAPGLVSVVEDGGVDAYESDTPRRERVVVHELLHNVVGRFTVAGNVSGDGYHVLERSEYNTTNYDISAENYYNTYGTYLIGPSRPISYYGEWNISQATERELTVNGFKAPDGDGFPPTNRSGPPVVVAATAADRDALPGRSGQRSTGASVALRL